MRIAWLCPWFSTLAAAYGPALRRQGHEVLIVTTDAHYESRHPAGRQPGRPGEPDVVLTSGIKRPADWRGMRGARRALACFAPELVLLDETWDARFHLLASGHPTALLVHDGERHAGDVDHALYRPLMRRARRRHPIATFSTYVGERVGSALPPIRLASEMPPEHWDAARVEPAERRRDFCLFGRLHPYKNVPGTLEVWEQYTASPTYAGDRLLLLGDGDVKALPAGVEHRSGVFRFADAAPVIARSKASLCWYSEASQSGVQVVSMQCGVMPLVSDVGGLPEYQGDLVGPIPLTRPDALLAELERLTDPTVAADEGARARRRFDSCYAADPAAASLISAARLAVTGRRT